MNKETNYIYSIYCARKYLDDDMLFMHGDIVMENDVLDKVVNCESSCMVVSSTLTLPEKDFKAVVRDGKVVKVGVEFFNEAMAAAPVYKLFKKDWQLWLDKIEAYCEAGNTKVYAENALNELDGAANITALDVENLLCAEIDNQEDLAVIYAKLKEIEADLNESGIVGILSDNIARDALLKFSYVSPQGACGLYYDVPAGEIQKPGEIRDCFAGLVHEIDTIADAMDIHFAEDIVKRNIDILDTLVPTATTSLQRDIAAGHESEIDGLIYEVIRLADKYDIEAPIYRKIAGALKERLSGQIN